MTLFCYWRLNDLFCNERRSDGCSEDCRCYLMAQTTPTPENCPFPLRDLSPSNTWFLGPQFRVFKRHIDRFSHFCTAHRRVSHYFTLRRYVPSPKNCPFPSGDQVRHLTHDTYGLPESSSQTACPSVQPFCMAPKCCAVQCIVSGKKTPKLPLPLRISSPCRRTTEPRP